MILAFICTIFMSAILTAGFNVKIGRNGVSLILLGYNSINIFLFFLQLSLKTTIFSAIQYKAFTEFNLFTNFHWGFLIDLISFFFLGTILIITTSIIIFACSYMYTDIRFNLFLSFLQFFMFFMLILILSNNTIQLFIGWEGVGVISFLLINFWYLRLNSNKSALKALIFNRIGDFGYMVFLVVCLASFHTVNFNLFNFTQNEFVLNTFSTVMIFILLAIFGKSAQLLLYAWLPDAMEGPTPVSALLHSATMVTAGVYLFLRIAELVYNTSILWIYLILIIGGITSIFCGLYALVKFDVKKIIAFSTCSQLGLMFCTIALGYIFPAFYHLFIHAFFKALLFVSSGIIIHALADEQDIRKYGVNFMFVPFFHIILLLGSLNIMGFFFFSGFYSKELLLVSSIGSFVYIFKSLIIISSIFTIMYSIRLGFYSAGFNRNYRNILNQINSFDINILSAVMILSLGSIFTGYFFADVFIGIGTPCYLFLNIPYTTLNFELTTYSIPFLFPILITTIFLFYKTNFNFIYKTTNTLYFMLCLKVIVVKEFYIQSVYWLINILFNTVVYKYIVCIAERGILDKMSLLGLVFTGNVLLKNFEKIFKDNIIATILTIMLSLMVIIYYINIIMIHFHLSVYFIILVFLQLNITKQKQDKLT